MPAPIELLYRLTDRDAALPQWGFFSKTLLVQQTARDFMTDVDDFRALIPAGFLLNITRLGAHCQPGLGQNVESCGVVIFDNPGASQQNVAIPDIVNFHRSSPIANEPVANSETVDLIFTRDEYGAAAMGSFNADANVNSVRLIFSGYLLPRGNFSRF
jgi:hypothetical protein